jgi:hypothetical protein
MRRLNLLPLQQWVCDTCEEIIEKPEHGYVEYKYKLDSVPLLRHDFRVVHHAPHSPYRKSGANCYYPNSERGGDWALTNCLGARGLVLLTSWIDPGKEFVRSFDGPGVKELREWVVLLRRLHVPFYEEARFFFQQAHRDDNLGGSNDFLFYSPKGLQEILREYPDGE